jgi:drug/metabolite transporter superfamily protein YnfA
MIESLGLLKVFGLFFLTAIAELVGCYLPPRSIFILKAKVNEFHFDP